MPDEVDRGPIAPAPAGSGGSHHAWGQVRWLTGPAAALAALGIFLSLLMGSLDQFVVLNALPNIVVDIGQPNGITFIVTSYLITSTVAVPIFARLSDILSRRNIFLIGMGIFIAGSVLAGVSQDLNELIVFRGVQGFGSGCFFPVGISIIAVAFSPQRRARLTGAFSGVFGIATVAGPFLGDYIVTHTTWRWVFYINIPIGILGMAVIATSLGVLRPAQRESFDALGAGLLTGWVGALMFALFQVADAGWAWTDARVLGLLIAAAILLAVFLFWELRVDKPLLPLRLLGDRVVASSGAVAALSRAAVFSLLTLISVYVGIVVYHGGAGAADAVRNMLYFMVLPMVLGALVGGQGLTRVSYRSLVAGGLAIATVGLYFLTLVTASTPLWTFWDGFLPVGGIVLPLIPIGFGIGLTFGPTTIAVQFRVPPKDVGQATGLVQFLGTLGASIALPIFSTYQAWRATSLAPDPPAAACFAPSAASACTTQVTAYDQGFVHAVVTSYIDVFTIMVVLSGVALVASLFLRGRLPKDQSPRGSGPGTE
ncbi:MAG TPA: MFS transporter [Thermoplasmata archaeon]|nr:MFS transporter [Thermoplasmata archaeon]